MRNIVLITIDDLRYDHCSFTGYKRKTTPTIDKMARRGLIFKNAVAPSSKTIYSMKAIFTGTHLNVPIQVGGMVSPEVRVKILKEFQNNKTLAQVLSERGYSTGAFTPSAYASSYFGFDKGFHYFHDFIFKSRKKGLSRLYGKIFKEFNKGKDIAFVLRSFLDFIQGSGAFMHWEKYYDNIIDWVEKTKEPFFLWCFPLDTHRPYAAPRNYRKWSNFIDMYFYNYYYNWKITKSRGVINFSEKDRKKLINAYDDSIYYTDSFVKRLWKDLKTYDPIFIIHADHGEGFGEHGLYAHPEYLYEELIHVPLVIYNSELKGCVNEPVSLLGLGPTILELIGEKNELPSKSFLGEKDDVIISQIWNGGRKIAVRIKNWKYIFGQGPIDELYNLRNDPHERVNLVEKHPRLTEEMRKIVKCFIAKDLVKKVDVAIKEVAKK